MASSEEQGEVGPASALGGNNDDHDVGKTGQRQGDKGRVYDRDEEDAEEAEREEQVDKCIGVSAKKISQGDCVRQTWNVVGSELSGTGR